MCAFPKPIRVVKYKPTSKSKEENETKEPILVHKDIAKKIYDARTSLNYKREDLAMMMNRSAGLIRDWETGKAHFDRKTASLFEKHLRIKLNK